jgi:single-strand DNA-binding protein
MINKVILVGRVGRAEMKGNKVKALQFSIATTESWKKDDEWQEKTEWHNCTIFDKFAKAMKKSLKKGALVYVEGKIRTEKYEDEDGVEKYATKILVDTIRTLAKAKDKDEDQDEDEDEDEDEDQDEDQDESEDQDEDQDEEKEEKKSSKKSSSKSSKGSKKSSKGKK